MEVKPSSDVGGGGARRTTEMSEEGEIAMVMRMVIEMINTCREGEGVMVVLI